MLDVLDSTKQLYTESSHKTVVITLPNRNITFTNGNVEQESVELDEKLETETQLNFIGCNSTVFKFNIAELLQDLRGEYIEATIQAEDSEIIPLFKGYVTSQTNRTYEDVITEIECEDVLYKIRDLDVTSWYTGLASTRTGKQFRDSFFGYLYTQYGYNIEQVIDGDATSLILDSTTLTKISSDKLPKVINAGWVLESICQANVRPGQIGRDGKLHYRKLKVITKGTYPSLQTFPSPDTFPSGENSEITYSRSEYKSIKYEPYYVHAIDGVSIKDINGADTSYGTNPTNVFNVADNIVIQMLSTASRKASAAEAIYNEVRGVWYVPISFECMGFPWVECGDAMMINTRRNVVRTFVLTRHLKGIQALLDTLEAQGLEYRDKYTESTETGVSSTRDRVEKIEATYITATNINAKSFTLDAGHIGNLDASKITTGEFDSDRIKANAITTNKIASGAVTSTQLSANSVTAGKIAAGAITAEKISADAFSGNQFSGSTFRMGSAICSSLSVGGGTGGAQWGATWKQFDQIQSGDFVLYHSAH